MKKCVFYTALSCLTLTILALVVAYFGYQLDLFLAAIPNLLGLFENGLWYAIIPPAVALLVLLISLIVKGKTKKGSKLVPFALFISILAYLLVVPRALPELLDTTAAPQSLVFTTGAAGVVLLFLVLFVLAFVDMIFPTKKQRAAQKELESEVYEVVVEEPTRGPHPAPVEYSDQEVEDEDNIEEVSAAERKAAEKPKAAPKAKPKPKATVSKKEEKKEVKEEVKKEKEYDRIYHIMKRAKDDRWIVKIAQSRKAIKIFDTQKEAIEYAEILASNNNGVVRVFASKGANKGRIIQ
ncbi:MAG: hypothetical protein BWY30_00805 [Tenericutes bacterium ADurb.Bin239]|jgi:hypothetical protein|nr:MAG: hypothetical protein BWY30_00805 [Tenericutes bacterium ADurb.Bin239]